MSKVLAFLKDDSGATAIEYGLIAAGISVVIIATVNTIGSTSIPFHKHLDAAEVAPSTALAFDRRRAFMQSV
jgi:pilus assembly protein Flp/PilA